MVLAGASPESPPNPVYTPDPFHCGRIVHVELGNPEHPEDAGSSHRRRRSPTSRRIAVLSIAVVLIVIVATLAGYYALHGTSGSTSPYPSPPAGWSTFRSAWATVSSTFAALSAGSFTLLYAAGVASDSPWSPPAILWAEEDPTNWSECAAQLSGISTLTFWNESAYPSSKAATVFTSGAAPLWTFVFRGEDTPTIVATWLTGKVVLNGALEPSSPCFSLSGPIEQVFTGFAGGSIDYSSYADSDVVAAKAVAAGALSPAASPGKVILYFAGPQNTPVTVYAGPSWVMDSAPCGWTAALGDSFEQTIYTFNSSSGQPTDFVANASWTCSDAYFELNMTNASISPPNSSGLYQDWSLSWSLLSSAVPTKWTVASLTTSMLLWHVLGAFPSAPAVCTSPSPNLSSCAPPSSGWYAVLTSAEGAWLDSYPTSANGTQWTISDLSVVPGDRILFVGAPGFSLGETFRPYFDTEPTVFGGAVVDPP